MSSPFATPDLAGRDRLVVQHIARFKQLASRHIHQLVFNETTSKTPADRTLRRLVERGYVIRIERRLVGGSRGGSGQYVYALGRRGFFLHFVGRYVPARTVNYHALAIADAYVSLKRLERSGAVSILGVSCEPDCWVRIGGSELKPDLHLELRRGTANSLRLWLEVDMGTESQRQLREKFERYWRAWNDADVTEWPVFPRVLFVAIDDERDKELRWLIEQGPKEARQLFQVTTLTRLPELFQG